MRNWLIEGCYGLLFVIGTFAFFGLCAVISWPILQCLTHLTNHFFIPYATTSYLHLSGGIGGFPASILGIASIPFRNVPNSFFVFAWAFALCSQIAMFKDDWANLPKSYRKGKTRAELIQLLWQRKLKFFAFYSVILFVLCVPGLRCYQVVSNEQIHYVGYFSLQEKSLPLSALKSVKRYVYGRANGYIGWDLLFNDGTVLDLTAPNSQALQQLLALPNVTSNVLMRDGKLFLK